VERVGERALRQNVESPVGGAQDEWTHRVPRVAGPQFLAGQPGRVRLAITASTALAGPGGMSVPNGTWVRKKSRTQRTVKHRSAA